MAAGRLNAKTLASELRLQARVKKTWDENPGMTMTILAERFGANVPRMKALLSDAVPYPPGYKLTAGRIGRSVEEVAENKEAGRCWCRDCQAWGPGAEFYDSGNLSRRHYAYACVRGNQGVSVGRTKPRFQSGFGSKEERASWEAQQRERMWLAPLVVGIAQAARAKMRIAELDRRGRGSRVGSYNYRLIETRKLAAKIIGRWLQGMVQ